MSLYSKVKTNLIVDTYTTTTQLYNDFYSKGDTDNLLANKVYTTGDVASTGHLDIGTTYTSSRIRCNAEVNCYTGYAELKAAST